MFFLEFVEWIYPIRGGASWQTDLKFSDRGGGRSYNSWVSLANDFFLNFVGGVMKGHVAPFQVGLKMAKWFTTIVGA